MQLLHLVVGLLLGLVELDVQVALLVLSYYAYHFQVDLVVLQDALLVLDDVLQVINSFLLDLQVDLQLDVLKVQNVVLDVHLQVVPLVLRFYPFRLKVNIRLGAECAS